MLKNKKYVVLLSSFMLAVLFLAASGCQKCKKGPEKSGSPTSSGGGNATETVQPLTNPIEPPKNGVSSAMLGLTGNNLDYSLLHKILKDIRDGNPLDIEVEGNQTDGSSTTALAQAFALNDPDILNLLLQKEADQYSPDKRYANTLRTAAQTLDLPLLKFLLKQPGINLNVSDVAGSPVLCTIVGQGDFSEQKRDFLKAFLADSTKFDINAVDVLGNTALHRFISNVPNTRAGCMFQEDVFRQLLNVDGISLQKKNGKGETPLHVAVEYQPEFLRDLLDTAAGSNPFDINLQNNLGETVLYRWLVSIDYPHGHRYRDVLKRLKDEGADFNIPANNGDTVLHVAIKTNDARRLARLLIALKDYKSMLNFALPGADNKTVEQLFQEKMLTIDGSSPLKIRLPQLWNDLHT